MISEPKVELELLLPDNNEFHEKDSGYISLSLIKNHVAAPTAISIDNVGYYITKLFIAFISIKVS